jgi:hypothetical protein
VVAVVGQAGPLPQAGGRHLLLGQHSDGQRSVRHQARLSQGTHTF